MLTTIIEHILICLYIRKKKKIYRQTVIIAIIYFMPPILFEMTSIVQTGKSIAISTLIDGMNTLQFKITAKEDQFEYYYPPTSY